LRCCAGRYRSIPGAGHLPIRIASWRPPEQASARPPPILDVSWPSNTAATTWIGCSSWLTVMVGCRRAQPENCGDLYRSARWRELYHPHGIGDELRLALFADGYCWGYLELLRDRTGHHFTTEEAEFLLRLSAPMAKALRAALTCVSSPATDVVHGPGTLILDAHNAIQATTPEAEQWLAVFRSYAIPAEALFPAPMPVLSVRPGCVAYPNTPAHPPPPRPLPPGCGPGLRPATG
jgi:hypothetical protein